MSKKTDDQTFALMPVAALRDRRLHEAELRTLGVVAFFDRRGKNGRGCFATRATLADRSGLKERAVFYAMRRLCDLGYLTKHGEKGRRPHFQVEYGTGITVPVLVGETCITVQGLTEEPCTTVQPTLHHGAVNPAPRCTHKRVVREKKRQGRAGAHLPADKKRDRGTRITADWTPTADDVAFAKTRRPDLDVGTQVELFRNYWLAATGARASKQSWSATWQNWIIRERPGNQTPRGQVFAGTPRRLREFGT